MNRREIQSILMMHRPDRPGSDKRTEEALEQAKHDAELCHWLEGQQEFHKNATESLRGIPVPGRLRESLLRRGKIIKVAWWRQRTVWAAAAAVTLLATFLIIEFKPPAEAPFSTYRSRMVRAVLRQYTMDVVTNDMQVIQRFLAQREAPSDYILPPALAKLPPTGAGVLSWQGRRVSMVCLNGGKQGTLFLFVADSNSVARAPSGPPTLEQVSTLGTVSWQQNGKLYVLAGHADSSTLSRYL